MDPGAQRRSRWSACALTCSRRSAREAAKPPVASTSGASSGSSRSGLESRSSPAASATSARVRRSGSKRMPVVSSLPVSRATTGAPSDSSQVRSPSTRSNSSRCSSGSPPGHSARKRSNSRWRQTTPLDRRIDPPGRSSFSNTTGVAPRRRASAAATRPAMPGAGDDEVAAKCRSDQGEARLVLDVLDAHAGRSAQEDGERVGRVLDVVDLARRAPRPRAAPRRRSPRAARCG